RSATARRKLWGADGGPCRAERCADIAAKPQASGAAVEGQATRGVLLENRRLVTKRENLRLQGRTGSKTGGYQGEKGDEKRAHRGSHHDLTIDRNLFVFIGRRFRQQQGEIHPSWLRRKGAHRRL